MNAQAAPRNLTFPITLESFIAYQELPLGRKLDSGECELAKGGLEIINDVYVSGDAAVAGAYIRILEQLIDENENLPQAQQSLASVRYWVARAWAARQDVDAAAVEQKPLAETKQNG